VVGVLGSLPTHDLKIAADKRGDTAFERAFHRGASVATSDPSLAMRVDLWGETARMIAAHPLAGVGAGAWENETTVEEDFQAHNEFLQLVAEYGIAGWVFIAGLFAWLCRAAAATWRMRHGPDTQEAAWRTVLLASVGALLIVSNAGFPWRLASTGALFALCLGALAASDLRIEGASRRRSELGLPAALSRVACIAAGAALALAAYVTGQAVSAERHLARATHIALAIGASANPNDPVHDSAKAEMLHELAEGIAINRHYRRLTPIAADAMARWGDWKDAIWVWESVLSSRPNSAAILCNVARGYVALGRPERALPYVERAKRIQPDAPAVRAVDALVQRAQMSSSKG
jgi:tetratricopeptide (TPR) repeat protein